MNAEFYVIDGDGTQVSDEVCGCLNAFNTYKQALEVARKVSRKNEGQYSVTVAIPSTTFENGKEVELW